MITVTDTPDSDDGGIDRRTLLRSTDPSTSGDGLDAGSDAVWTDGRGPGGDQTSDREPDVRIVDNSRSDEPVELRVRIGRADDAGTAIEGVGTDANEGDVEGDDEGSVETANEGDVDTTDADEATDDVALASSYDVRTLGMNHAEQAGRSPERKVEYATETVERLQSPESGVHEVVATHEGHSASTLVELGSDGAAADVTVAIQVQPDGSVTAGTSIGCFR